MQNQRNSTGIDWRIILNRADERQMATAFFALRHSMRDSKFSVPNYLKILVARNGGSKKTFAKGSFVEGEAGQGADARNSRPKTRFVQGETDTPFGRRNYRFMEHETGITGDDTRQRNA